MANEENRVISHIRTQMKSAHWLLEETISDVSDVGELPRPGAPIAIGEYCYACTAGTGFT